MTEPDAVSIENWKNHFGSLPQLTIKFEDVEERLPGLLVGQLPGRYLIVTKPNALGIDKFIKIGSALKIIHLFEGSIYGFAATIIGHIDSPSRLMFISYPEQIEQVELREHARLSAQIPASLATANESHAGIVWDLSLGGCRFVTASEEHGLETGDGARLEVTALGAGQPLEIHCIVRSFCRADAKLMFGLQFDRYRSSAQLRMIEAYVNQVLNFMNGA